MERNREMTTRRRDPVAGLLALVGGALVAVSLPPWGWWPLALVGVAVLDWVLADLPRRTRFFRGWLFGMGWLPAGMAWMWYMTPAGWIVATVVYAGYIGTACAVAPGGPWRRLGVPAAITVAEAIRWSFPFGGVPLASLAIGQAAGPLAPVVRMGGALLLTWLTLIAGMALSALLQRAWRPALAGLAVVAVALVVAITVAPDGRTVGEVRITFVQGGGRQGTRAADTDPQQVFQRHLDLTRTLVPGRMDLVVWPENVVDVVDFSRSPERADIAAQSARLGVPILVGITEDAGPNHFRNAQVVVLPDGSLGDRYDKVRIVPFGEFLPLRALIDLVPGQPTDLVGRDAIAGDGPAVLNTPKGPMALAISWEIFFGGRARDGVKHGGLVLLNPTNGSSYRGTILQTQQIASSRLRALETARWVVQAAPTGFSGFITPDGTVIDRTRIGEASIGTRTIEERAGETWYVRIGDRLVVAVAVALLAIAMLLGRRRVVTPETPPASEPGSHLEKDGDRPVVHQLDGHLRPEPTGGHLGPESP
ncbi:MAG TPA: apolipoprotein N-acyltransferase [Acidimicrobiales bacterium]|nr:apolipoprotein N-acyltransferase [Acidimicrobiales bacterium]